MAAILLVLLPLRVATIIFLIILLRPLGLLLWKGWLIWLKAAAN